MKQFLFPVFAFFLLSTFSLFAQQATPPNLSSASLAEITFADPVFEYGMIEAGEKVLHTYLFTNTGTEPLVLSNAKGSCGCTVPEWPKEPILPGESAEVVVQFNSKGKKGVQSKRVTITANTEPAQTFLTIKGEVYMEEEGTAMADVRADESDTPSKISSMVNSYVVYPNPTSDLLQVKLKEVIGERVHLVIYNELGQIIEERNEAQISLAPISFDVSAYPAGAYRMVVQVDEGMAEAKPFVVIRE